MGRYGRSWCKMESRKLLDIRALQDVGITAGRRMNGLLLIAHDICCCTLDFLLPTSGDLRNNLGTDVLRINVGRSVLCLCVFIVIGLDGSTHSAC